MSTPPVLPPHLILINTLCAHGWESTGPEPSALITGLTAITLTAPVGELAVRIEAVGHAAMLTLTANSTQHATNSARSRARWRALGPLLSASVLEEIARAEEGARLHADSEADIDELIDDLEARGWIHTEEHSHDELLCGQVASPDATIRITWGPDEEKFHITDRRTHTTITADYTTPPGVLRAMAGITDPACEAGEESAPRPGAGEVLRRAREFGEAARRLSSALPTTSTPGEAVAVAEVSAGRGPLAGPERDEILEVLADAAHHISHAVTYLKATATAHGGDPDGVGAALTPVKGLISHVASILREAIPDPDEDGVEETRATP